MRIVLASMALQPALIARLSALDRGAIHLVHDEPSAIAAIADADALACSDLAYTPRLAEAVRSAQSLRWLQLLTAGYDNALRHGVPPHVRLTNVGDAFTPSVALHAVTLLLALQRRLSAILAQQTRREWNKTLSADLVMPADRTALIIGFGGIGQEIARLLTTFGMTVLATRRSPSPHRQAVEVYAPEALHDLLPRADAVMLAAPLTPQTDRLIGRRELALCRPTAHLVNVSRGALVDGMALAESLRENRLAGAALDVTEPEPLPPDHPLWTAPNTIISPHVAGASDPYGAERQFQRAAADLRRFLAGELPLHVITRADNQERPVP
jgi:phosphoglycerate dehydrogenase-like enzyme